MSWTKKTYVKSSMQPNDKQYAMFVGRWQPLHDGHKELFKQALIEGKNVLICIRDMQPDKNNPFTANEVKNNIKKHYNALIRQGLIKVIIIPDICSIEFGRGVGYDIIEHVPPIEISKISATNIRKNTLKK